MKKINFQDLPNTDTPIKASTLNTMQSNIEESCVAVSPTQPETNEKVWIQKGKNLFNKNNYGLIYGYPNGNTIVGDTGNYMFYVPCEKNTEYTISKKLGSRFGIYCSEDFPIVETTISALIRDDTKTTLTVTTTDTANYLIVYALNTWETGEITLQELLDTLQIEQGSTATEYEAYIEETVWVKNDNGVYVPFKAEKKTINITTGVEFETGRIIDGKKEYGKILNIGTVPSNTSKVYATGISNFERYTYLDGYTNNAWGVKFVPNKINDSSIVLTQEGENLRVQTWQTSYADAGYQGYIEMHYIKTT